MSPIRPNKHLPRKKKKRKSKALTLSQSDLERSVISLLEKANENVRKSGFTPINGSSDNLPLKDGSVDIIVSRCSLIYCKNKNKSLSEIYRVLKSDGKVILEDINKNYQKWKLFLTKIHMFFKNASFDIIRYHTDAFKIAFTFYQVKKLLINSSFNIVYEENKKNDWKFIIIGKKRNF